MTTKDIEGKIEKCVKTVKTVEFLHGVPVSLPSQYKADLRGAMRAALTEVWNEAIKENDEDIKLLTEEIERLRNDVNNIREQTIKEERERIRVFVANNYRIDYANPAIDLEVIMGELEPLSKPNITSDKQTEV